MADRQTVAIDLAEVRGLAEYIAETDEGRSELDGAWEVIGQLGLTGYVIEALEDMGA